MKNPVLWGAVLVVAILVATAAWFAQQLRTTGVTPSPSVADAPISNPAPVPPAAPTATPAPPALSEPPPAPSAAPEPAPAASPSSPSAPSSTVRYPIESRPSELPTLSNSDMLVRGALIALIGVKSTDTFLRPIDVIRHVVATVDDLPRAKLPQQNRPIQATPGLFAAAGTGDSLVVDAANPKRYAAFIRLVQATDAERLVAMYKRFYPLFQQAYRESGRFPSYFNDRVVEVIDHLLAAPEISGPIKLVLPKVMYLYADAALEGRSAGHKILIRMGPANASIVKAKLREIRRLVTDPAMLRGDSRQ
jgi:Protein of unknown function (DUF3014)